MKHIAKSETFKNFTILIKVLLFLIKLNITVLKPKPIMVLVALLVFVS